MRKIVDIKATGQNIVVELLSAQEAAGTGLILSENTKGGDAPQAYIKSIGPLVDTEKHGIAVGDRILFSGMMTPLPKNEFNSRQRGVIDAFTIKSVLKEEETNELVV